MKFRVPRGSLCQPGPRGLPFLVSLPYAVVSSKSCISSWLPTHPRKTHAPQQRGEPKDRSYSCRLTTKDNLIQVQMAWMERCLVGFAVGGAADALAMSEGLRSHLDPLVPGLPVRLHPGGSK